jgi:GPI mannosyltransferase 1 subunit M
MIVQYRRRNRHSRSSNSNDNNGDISAAADSTTMQIVSSELQDALWWLYNPLAINICTRGSAESLVVLLPVLITVWIATTFRPTWYTAIGAGICHGVAIHAKLYPIVYTLSFMTAFISRRGEPFGYLQQSKSKLQHLQRFLYLWLRRLLAPAPVLFGATSAAVFVGLTYLAVQQYGIIALEQGLLYHFSRVDHRHNYSMHWYWIYLARAATAAGGGSSGRGGGAVLMAWVGRILLLPQMILLVASSLGLAPHDLSLALFVQTFLFVAHNKVITAQYFTWYLCLLPLCSDHIAWRTQRMYRSLALFGASIVVWLLSAYCLEMQGMAVHKMVWTASVLFFAANVNLLGAILNGAVVSTQKAKRE